MLKERKATRNPLTTGTQIDRKLTKALAQGSKGQGDMMISLMAWEEKTVL